MQKNKKPPIPVQPDPKGKEPIVIKGTAEPTTKK